jgi:hypothetical protein
MLCSLIVGTGAAAPPFSSSAVASGRLASTMGLNVPMDLCSSRTSLGLSTLASATRGSGRPRGPRRDRGVTEACAAFASRSADLGLAQQLVPTMMPPARFCLDDTSFGRKLESAALSKRGGVSNSMRRDANEPTDRYRFFIEQQYFYKGTESILPRDSSEEFLRMRRILCSCLK